MEKDDKTITKHRRKEKKKKLKASRNHDNARFFIFIQWQRFVSTNNRGSETKSKIKSEI